MAFAEGKFEGKDDTRVYVVSSDRGLEAQGSLWHLGLLSVLQSTPSTQILFISSCL